MYVTIIGWMILCAYLALFFAVFGWLTARLRFPAFSVQRLCGVPAAWVALEYARTHLLSGFGWNVLAYTQTSWRLIIQGVDITGAWGLSFLIVLVNVALADLIALRVRRSRSARVRRGALRRLRVSLACVAVLLLGVMGYGVWRLRHLAIGPTVRVAVVQGNIPQEQKWNETYEEAIQQRYAALTRDVAAYHPDLIVWPETSVPGYLGVDDTLTAWVSGLAEDLHQPLLVGAPVPGLEQNRVVLHNSAVLIAQDGTLTQQYDKLHLVPFGEFIPFELQVPWLRRILPPIGDFSPGHQETVFHLNVRREAAANHAMASTIHLPFSVLICFEDVFPNHPRQFVREGARLLLVITNDAWFGPTAAAYQHAQASTFRAVELRVPVVRAANTGWSGCIDATGRWCGAVRDAQDHELFIEGTHICELSLGTSQTLYARWGDWFAWLCLIFSAGIMMRLRRRRASRVHG